MKRLLILATVTALIISFNGCIQNTPTPTAEETTTQATTPPSTTEATLPQPTQTPLVAVSLRYVTEEAYAEDGSLIFVNRYPNISLTIPDPDIADKIIVDFLNHADPQGSAEQVKNLAKEAYTDQAGPFPFTSATYYTPMRTDEGIISFYGRLSEYTGGAHENSGFRAINYDMLTGNALELGDILVDLSLIDAVKELVLQQLDPSKDEFYPDYTDIVEQTFEDMIASYKNWYLSNEGLCFFFSPYEIAPYAVGDVVAQIPYEYLTGILKDAYFPAEKETHDGTLLMSAFQDTDMDTITQIAEVVTDENGSMWVFQPDSSVRDVRISCDYPNLYGNTEYAEQHIVFGCDDLAAGDGIVVQVTPGTQITVTYFTADGEASETYEVN